MQLVNLTAFPFALLPGGRIRFPEWSATLVVKASFRLRPDGPPEPLDPPLPFNGDAFRDDELANDVLYDSDLAPWKPNADLLLTGTCHAPGGKPTIACRAEFGVGKWSKALAVIGHRVWKKGFLTSTMSDPEPFVSMPVTFAHAFGGPEFEKNPAGKGYDGLALPNVEAIDARVVSPGDRPEPAAFGPVNRTWPQRASKLGSYRGKWLKERWPHFPEDFDWTYWNAAPRDQQLPAYLRGDEEVRFENLHPKHPSYRAALPGIRIRCFLSEKIRDARRFREVPMSLDTLFVDADREQLVLVWRGVASVQGEEPTEIEHALCAQELLKDPPAPAAKFEALIPVPPPAPAPAAPPAPPAPKAKSPLQLELAKAREEAKTLEAAALERGRALAKEAGFDLDAALARPPAGIAELRASLAASKEAYAAMGAALPPIFNETLALVAPGGKLDQAIQKLAAMGAPKPPVTIDSLKAKAAKPGGLKGQDLSGARLAGADLSGLDLSGALLKGADLSGARLEKTLLRDAQLSGADLTGAKLAGADLTGADLTGALLAGAALAGAVLKGADLSEARAPKADLSGVQGEKATLARADLEGANLGKALLPEANLSGARLKGAKAAGAVLAKAALEGAKAEGADFREADLSGAAASGAEFRGAVFVKASAPQSIWEGSLLDGADFTGARLLRANFSGASLKQAKLVAVDAKNAMFPKAALRLAAALKSDFHESTFEKADLSGADFSGANLFGSEFLGAVLEGTKLQGAIVGMTKLA